MTSAANVDTDTRWIDAGDLKVADPLRQHVAELDESQHLVSAVTVYRLAEVELVGEDVGRLLVPHRVVGNRVYTPSSALCKDIASGPGRWCTSSDTCGPRTTE